MPRLLSWSVRAAATGEGMETYGEDPLMFAPPDDEPYWPGRDGGKTPRGAPTIAFNPLIANTLGTDAEHAFSGVVYSDPGSPAQFWHIDSPHMTADHQPPHALNVMVALHDITLAMGPTELASGSHRLTNHLRNPALVSNELVYQHETTRPELLVADTSGDVPERMSFPLTAGSCLVFDDRLLHRGLGNGSTSRRNVAYFSYRRADYCENTHFESQRSIYSASG